MILTLLFRLNIQTDTKHWWADKGDKTMTDIQKELNKAEEMFQDAVNEKMELLTLVRSINTSKPVNEKTWHKIMLTPLRTSKTVMSALTKSIFPDAEDIIVGCNAVQCHLYGFTILIPTSVETCIYIDTSWWYEKTEVKSFECWSYNKYSRLQNFLDDKNPSISTKVRYAIGNWYSKPMELIIYLMRRKEIEEKCDRNKLEAKLADAKEAYDKYCKTQTEKARFNHEQAEKMANILLPELRKFSNRFFNVRSRCSNSLDVKEILEKEGFML